MSYTKYLPVFLNLNGKNCLVVGGGNIALEKVNSLIDAGARVTVVSPNLNKPLQTLAESGKIHWSKRQFQEEDVAGAFLAIGATDDLTVNRRVFEMAGRLDKLGNSVDDPEKCNFIFSAIAKSGPLQVAVSSAGCSPALAQRIRKRIAGEIIEGLGPVAEFLGEWRPAVKARIEGYEARKRFWEQVLDSEIPALLSEANTSAERKTATSCEDPEEGLHPALERLFHCIFDDHIGSLKTKPPPSVGEVGELANREGGRKQQSRSTTFFSANTMKQLLEIGDGTCKRPPRPDSHRGEGVGGRGSGNVESHPNILGQSRHSEAHRLMEEMLNASSEQILGESAFSSSVMRLDSALPLASQKGELDRTSHPSGFPLEPSPPPERGQRGNSPLPTAGSMAKTGKVYLVGAGPGDPKLITIRAVEALGEADIVLYDRLANPKLLEYAPRAEIRYAGKELGIDSALRQEAILREMIEQARRGKVVVRLKGGDPYVFGRGGEEALALADAGVPFEVIPGISSAIAVPSSADIPVTHRGLSAAFAVFAGQTERAGLSDDLWRAASLMPTAIFLMGVERLGLIVSKLTEFGRASDTPIALISNGTLPEEKVVEGTLSTIVELAKGVYPPCVIVVGPCVGIRGRLHKLHKAEGLTI